MFVASATAHLQVVYGCYSLHMSLPCGMALLCILSRVELYTPGILMIPFKRPIHLANPQHRYRALYDSLRLCLSSQEPVYLFGNNTSCHVRASCGLFDEGTIGRNSDKRVSLPSHDCARPFCDGLSLLCAYTFSHMRRTRSWSTAVLPAWTGRDRSPF